MSCNGNCSCGNHSKNEVVEVIFTKFCDEAIIPQKRDEDAGMDIYGVLDTDYVIVPPHSTYMFNTGIGSSCSSDYYFQLEERSSVGRLGLSLRSGVIDSGYRGSWRITLTNTSDKVAVFTNRDIAFAGKVKGAVFEELKNKYAKETHMTVQDFLTAPDEDTYFVYSLDKALAQVLVKKVPKVKVKVVDEATFNGFASERGIGGFGSTGK